MAKVNLAWRRKNWPCTKMAKVNMAKVNMAKVNMAKVNMTKERGPRNDMVGDNFEESY